MRIPYYKLKRYKCRELTSNIHMYMLTRTHHKQMHAYVLGVHGPRAPAQTVIITT